MKPTYSELIQEVQDYKKQIESLEEDLEDKNDEIKQLQDEIWELSHEAEEGKLDRSTLDKQMMYDWIKEHWNELRLEDLKCLLS